MAVKKRKISKFVAVTMAIFVVLYAVVFSTSLYVQKTAEQQCYDTLRKSTENLGKEIKNNIYSRESVVGIYFPKDSLPGASIFWDGKIFTGKDGLAGEIKYLPDFINYRKITSADSVIEKLINTIVLFNSITAPGLFIIYAENINEDEFQKRVYDNEIIKRQPNVPVIKVADTFGEDIITGLQWLVTSDIDVQESAG